MSPGEELREDVAQKCEERGWHGAAEAARTADEIGEMVIALAEDARQQFEEEDELDLLALCGTAAAMAYLCDRLECLGLQAVVASAEIGDA